MAGHRRAVLVVAAAFAAVVPHAAAAATAVAPNRAELRIVRLINRERVKYHLSPLRGSDLRQPARRNRLEPAECIHECSTMAVSGYSCMKRRVPLC